MTQAIRGWQGSQAYSVWQLLTRARRRGSHKAACAIFNQFGLWAAGPSHCSSDESSYRPGAICISGA